MGDREQQIRERAHQIWEEERPDGRDREHWERAAREIGADGQREQEQQVRSGRDEIADSVGVASGLQRGGSKPGSGPGAGEGSLGTGADSTAGATASSPKSQSRT